MIISHKFKFIFIKTRKTGGTSIEVFLSQWCGENDVVTPIWPHVQPHISRNYTGLWNPVYEIIDNRGRDIKSTLHNFIKRNRFYNHIPAIVVRNRVPKNIWNSYFKFCVERNPWDKTLSHYYMINDRAGGYLAFDEYLRSRCFCFNYPQYTDGNGRLIVDKVIEYNKLNTELMDVFGMLGIPFSGSLEIRAKSEHRKDRRPYQKVFTHEQRELVAQAFSTEICLHGYTF